MATGDVVFESVQSFLEFENSSNDPVITMAGLKTSVPGVGVSGDVTVEYNSYAGYPVKSPFEYGKSYTIKVIEN